MSRHTLASCLIPGLCLLAAPFLAGAQWQRSTLDAINAAKLRSAHALFVSRTQSEPTTFEELARMRAHKRDVGVRAAALYAATGLPQQAEAALAPVHGDAGASTVQIAIARSYYELGDFRAAERVLVNMPQQLVPREAQQRASLLGRVLLQQQRYDEAALPLAALQQYGEISPLNRYNLGIAWMGAGVPARGAGELDALGRYDGDSALQRALADQANISLAYWLLRGERAGQARRILWRLPVDSPLARQGMLALGWTEFLDTGPSGAFVETEKAKCKVQPPELWQRAGPLHQVPRNRCRLPEVESKLQNVAPGYADAANKYQRAAILWRAVIRDGDPRNPVVAEALIALPYALVEAGDLAAGQAAYQQAINALSAADAALARGEFSDDATDAVATTPVVRLNALANSLTHMQARLATQIPAQIAEPDQATARDVAEIFADLRRRAPEGRSLAELSAVERGRLILAVDPQSNTAAAQTLESQNRHSLQQRAQRLQARIGQTLAGVSAQRQRIQEAAVLEQRLRIQAYLRQAALAFADLAQDRPE